MGYRCRWPDMNCDEEAKIHLAFVVKPTDKHEEKSQVSDERHVDLCLGHFAELGAIFEGRLIILAQASPGRCSNPHCN